MKKIFILIGFCFWINMMFAQSNDSLANNKQTNLDKDTSKHEVLGDSPKVEKSGDTTRIRLGQKGITIIEKNGKTAVNIDKGNNEEEVESNKNESEENESPEDNWKTRHHNNRFRPHFAGFELFLNNFMDKNHSISRNSSNEFMDLSTGKSIGVNINFLNYAFPFSSQVGVVTGLGMEINNYHFDNNNNIQKLDGVIQSKPAPDGITYDNTKFGDTYINVPLLLEVQFPLGHKNKPLYFSGGVIGGLKISSSSKVIYYENGNERKYKVHDDFFLSPIRYGFQGRVGYRAINLFATYYPTTLFEKNKGPELYPFDIGLALILF